MLGVVPGNVCHIVGHRLMTSVLEPYLCGIDGSLDMVSSFLVNESDQEFVRNAVPALTVCEMKSLGTPET